MAEKREWKGLTINEVVLLGRIVGKPQIVNAANGNKCAFMDIKTYPAELGANGQWVETEVLVPLVVMDHNKVVNVVEKYVDDERELLIKAYYKSWVGADGETVHGMIVTRIKLGSKSLPKQIQTGD